MKRNLLFFTKTKQLKEKFTTFLMNITSTGVIFNEVTAVYLKKQASPQFNKLKSTVQQLETENDSLRREIEAELYRQMILPGMRSDILDLMEACDHVINQYERVVILWSIEQLKVPSELFNSIKKLVKTTELCVSALTTGVHAFFEGQISVEDEVQRQAVDVALHLANAVFLDEWDFGGAARKVLQIVFGRRFRGLLSNG